MKKTITIIFAALVAFSVSMYAGPKKKREVKDVTFNVYLHCESCVEKVQENIAFEKGVKGLEVSLENQTVAIKYDAAKTSEAQLKEAIEELGYPVNGKVQPGQNGKEHHDHHGHGHHDHHDHGHQHGK